MDRKFWLLIIAALCCVAVGCRTGVALTAAIVSRQTVTTQTASSSGGETVSPVAIHASQDRAKIVGNKDDAEAIRAACIEGRRRICGPVLEITTNGFVVDSGFTSLLRPELSRSWVAPSTVAAERPPNLVEENSPDAVAVGLVLLTDVPRRPAVKLYDYVIIEGYPAGEYVYAPVPNVNKAIRRFCGTLDIAVRFKLQKAR